MARRGKRGRGKSRKKSTKGILGKIPLINNPTFRKAATGVGVASLGIAAISLVSPSIAQQPLIRPVLALAGGGIPGVIASLITGGGFQGLGNLFGGGNGLGSGGDGMSGAA